jgi:hypothetical protein
MELTIVSCAESKREISVGPRLSGVKRSNRKGWAPTPPNYRSLAPTREKPNLVKNGLGGRLSSNAPQKGTPTLYMYYFPTGGNTMDSVGDGSKKCGQSISKNDGVGPSGLSLCSSVLGRHNCGIKGVLRGGIGDKPHPRHFEGTKHL